MFKLDRILVGIDFSLNSNEIVRTLMDLIESETTQVLLLHVIPNLEKQCDTYLKKGELAQYQESVEQKAAKLVEDFAKKKLKRKFNYECIIAKGNPAAAILNLARTHKVQLILLGTSAGDRTDINRFGSTADKVLRGAPCPVLCVPVCGV